MQPQQKARMAVIDHVTNEAGLAGLPDVNINTTIISLTEDGPNWQATVKADAHTDRNYLVRYHANTGFTTVETFVNTGRTHWIRDELVSEEGRPQNDHHFMD